LRHHEVLAGRVITNSIIGLKLGGKLGTATGEHGEVVGAVVLIGISGAMAAGWL
jgi:putative Mn2+ efflux pump MntP